MILRRSMEITVREFEGKEVLSIGIISDTHGLLRPQALSALKGSDVILHGGDVGDEQILARLSDIAPIFTVRGNVDFELWCKRLPPKLTLTLGGLKVFMIHDISKLDRTVLELVDMVVYGHSHRPEIFEEQEVLFLNPGSAGPRRFNLPITLAKLVWRKGEKLTPELIQLAQD
ncbi:MAG: metallophosphoesterase family protein [Verrucomicrobia bacterium]|nr:metallophosphoesterase family protein [Verrucomicrobiota bacterium]MDA1067814.1 metallophosphoesterase family protein [Verrucomicrobiota bacterium]